MANTANTGQKGDGTSRRDFLYLATGAVGAVGVGAAVWPFVDQMNPSAAVLALATIEVDLSPISEGMVSRQRTRPQT